VSCGPRHHLEVSTRADTGNRLLDTAPDLAAPPHRYRTANNPDNRALCRSIQALTVPFLTNIDAAFRIFRLKPKSEGRRFETLVPVKFEGELHSVIVETESVAKVRSSAELELTTHHDLWNRVIQQVRDGIVTLVKIRR
jgi:hypothetical protein